MRINHLIIILMLFLPTVTAYTQIQYSLDNITFMDAENTSLNSTTIELLGDGINDDTTYYLRARQVWATNNSSWVYTTIKTDSSGVQSMPLATILGLGIMAAILVYIAFQLDPDHFLLKLIFVILALAIMMIIPSVLIANDSTTPLSVLKTALWAYRIFMVYISVYMIWHWFKDTGTFGKMFGSMGK